MAKGSRHPDYILIGVSAALLIFGILTLSNVSASLSLEKLGTTYYFLNHQILFGLIPGVVLAFLAFRVRLDFLKKWAPILLLINLILMAMVFLPKIGFEAGGAARWISLGKTTFQPSEFLKLTFVLYLAVWIGRRTENKISVKETKEWSQTLVAFLVTLGLISLLLYFQRDISTLGVIGICAILMYFLAGTPLWQNALLILAGAGALFSFIKLAPYRADRLLVFLKPETDPMGIGYQIKQALIAVGSGGMLGLGLGTSRQIGFIPQSMSDSIFAILAEETGFIGSLVLILLFLIFFWRAFKISKQTKDKFSQLTCLGIGSWIVIQGFINIGSMIGLLPLTGIPLPFFSYGGSALISELIGVGILLNISKQ